MENITNMNHQYQNRFFVSPVIAVMDSSVLGEKNSFS